ncbi:MAG TPA: antibiotic biosynthesis monooxygenase [Gemmatimonadales bacterium]|nr:antibiotic biosynthesis monooxygenase [Gemmatimonadales bacterium]
MSARSANSTASRPPLIARLWHGVVPAAKGDAYAAYLRATGVAECRATPGNRGVQVLRRTLGAETHFLFISLWESIEAIRRFAGAEVERARYYPEDRGYLLELEPTVTHYEVVER